MPALAAALVASAAHADDWVALRAEGSALLSSANRYGAGAGVSYAVYPGEDQWYLHGYRLGALATITSAPGEASSWRGGITADVAMLLFPSNEGHRFLTYVAAEPWIDIGFGEADVDGGVRPGLEEEFRWKEIDVNLRLGAYYAPSPRLGWGGVQFKLTAEWNFPPAIVEPGPCPPEVCGGTPKSAPPPPCPPEICGEAQPSHP